MIKATKDLLTKLGIVKENTPTKSQKEKLAEIGDTWGAECKLMITRDSDSLEEYYDRVATLISALKVIEHKATIVKDVGISLLKIQVKNKDMQQMMEIVNKYKHGRKSTK